MWCRYPPPPWCCFAPCFPLAKMGKRPTPILPPLCSPARGVVRWVGDPVAFVIAETAAQAADAAELVEVDYDPLPVVTGTEAALAPNATQVWPDAPNNICYVWQGGDKAAGDIISWHAPDMAKPADIGEFTDQNSRKDITRISP